MKKVKLVIVCSVAALFLFSACAVGGESHDETSSLKSSAASQALSSQKPLQSSEAPASSKPAPKLNLSFQPVWLTSNLSSSHYINSKNQLVQFALSCYEGYEQSTVGKSITRKEDIDSICANGQDMIAKGSLVNMHCDTDAQRKIYAGELSKWTNLVQVLDVWNESFTAIRIGLTAEGKVLCSDLAETWPDFVAKVSEWENIVCLTTFDNSLYGLRSDGTIVCASRTPDNKDGSERLKDLKDVVFITGSEGNYSYYSSVFCLKKDGTVVDQTNTMVAENVVRLYTNGFARQSDGTLLYYHLENSQWTTVGKYDPADVFQTLLFLGEYDPNSKEINGLYASLADGKISVLEPGGNKESSLKEFDEYLSSVKDIKVFS